MAAKFEVSQHEDGQYGFVLKAANGEVVAESQSYESASAAWQGAGAVKRAAAEAPLSGGADGDPGEDFSSPDDGVLRPHY